MVRRVTVKYLNLIMSNRQNNNMLSQENTILLQLVTLLVVVVIFTVKSLFCLKFHSFKKMILCLCDICGHPSLTLA